MILPDTYLFTAHTQLITGQGSRKQIRQILDLNRLSRPFLITGRQRDRALNEGQIDFVGAYNIKTDHARFRQVHELKAMIEAADCDCIVVTGGSGAIDTAKATVISLAAGGELDQVSDLHHINAAGSTETPVMPIIAIPTISGTFTSATRYSTLFEPGENRQQFISSQEIIPRTVILDPEIAFAETPAEKSSAAMEAFSYAVDAFTGLGKNPLSDGFAYSAIRLLYPAMIEAVATTSAEAHSALLEGAYLAGQASSNSMPGILYALSQTLSALCGIPHQLCAAIFLPYCVEYNHHKISRLLTELSALLENSSEPADHEFFPDLLRTMNRKLFQVTSGNHAWRFHDIMDKQGNPLMRPDHILYAARMSMGSWMGFNNPEQADFEDLKRIIQAAYWGYPLDRELVKKGHQR